MTDGNMASTAAYGRK